MLQVGSQHRSKAEPAGAVVGDKWVPSKPAPEQMTLMGEAGLHLAAWRLSSWQRMHMYGHAGGRSCRALRTLVAVHRACRRTPGPLLPQP